MGGLGSPFLTLFFFLDNIMTANILPTLSTAGWVGAVSEKADRLMAYFFESDGLQSTLYRDKVFSLPMIVKDFKGDPVAVTQAVQSNLSNYLTNYFDAVEVQASNEVASNGEVTIKIYAKLTEKGKEYSLGKLVVLADNNISKVITLNN